MYTITYIYTCLYPKGSKRLVHLEAFPIWPLRHKLGENRLLPQRCRFFLRPKNDLLHTYPKKIEVGKSPPKCCKDVLFAFLWGFLFQSLWTKVTKGPISHHPIPIIFPSAPWALGCSCPCQCNRPTVNVQIGCPARELSLWCSLYGDFDLPAAAIPRKSPAISRSHPDQHVFLEETCRNV